MTDQNREYRPPDPAGAVKPTVNQTPDRADYLCPDCRRCFYLPPHDGHQCPACIGISLVPEERWDLFYSPNWIAKYCTTCGWIMIGRITGAEHAKYCEATTTLSLPKDPKL